MTTEGASGEQLASPREEDLERQDQQDNQGEGSKSPRTGTTTVPPAAEPHEPPMPEEGSDEILEQEDPLPSAKSPRSPRDRPETPRSQGEGSNVRTESSQVRAKKRAKKVAKSATVQGAAFAIHWFGARRFDYDDSEEHRKRMSQLRRQSAMNTKDVVREMMREDFKRKRKSKSSNNLAENRTPKGKQSTKNTGESRQSTATSGTQDTRTTIDTMMEDAGDAFESGHDAMFQAQTSGVFTQEELITQNRPWFIMGQVFLCFILWLVFTFVDGMSLAGLESIFRGKTLVLVHRDCQDYRPEIWRLWTYQFSHTGVGHVLTNCLIAIVAGMPLEGFNGLLRTAGIFNVGVVVGAMNHMVVMAHSAALAGMSAGCYALLGMHWGDLIMNWRQSKFRRAKLLLLVILIAIDVLSNSILAPAPEPGMPEVSHSSHLGGFLAGLLAGILFCRNLKVTNAERIIQGVSVFLCVVGLIFLGGWLVHWPPKGLFDSVGWCWLRQANNRTVFGDLQWHCLQCGDDACIQGWAHEASLNPITPRDCARMGIWE